MKIDIHAHTSNHKLWGLHTETATISDLERLAKKHGIKKIILMATYFPFKKSGLFNQQLLERIKGNDLFAMFGSLDVANNFEKGLAELKELAEQKSIVGIKLYPGYQEFSLSDAKLWPVYQLSQEYDLPVTVHTGELHHCCPSDQRKKGEFLCGDACKIDQLGHLSEPKSMTKAIESFPQVKFILSHLGNPYFEQVRQLIKDYPNVYTEISGQFLSGSHESTPQYKQEIITQIKKILELDQGIQRLIFGTDFPIQSYEDSIELIESLGLNQAEKEKIYYHNAIKILNLKEG